MGVGGGLGRRWVLSGVSRGSERRVFASVEPVQAPHLGALGRRKRDLVTAAGNENASGFGQQLLRCLPSRWLRFSTAVGVAVGPDVHAVVGAAVGAAVGFGGQQLLAAAACCCCCLMLLLLLAACCLLLAACCCLLLLGAA